MLSRTSFKFLRFISFSARTRWPLKEQKFSTKLTENLLTQQQISQSAKICSNLDNPVIMMSKEPTIDIFLNKTLQDIEFRYKLLNKTAVNPIYGINCYGMQVVEALLDTKERSAEPLKIREICRKFSEETISNFKKSYKKWGILCSEKSHYSTLDKNFEFSVTEGFSLLYKQRIFIKMLMKKKA